MNEMLALDTTLPDMVPDRQWVSVYLEQAVAHFHSDPKTPQLLRCLAKEYPELFFAAASKHVEEDADSPARRLLAFLLLRQESLLERLTNPSHSCARAVRLFKGLMTADPTLDFKLGRMLPGRDGEQSDRLLSGKQAARAIEILDQTSPGQRLMSVIGHLPNCADSHISSKAALFVGHRVSNPAWLARQLDRDDPRIRANVVESTWGTKSEIAVRILEECIMDPNNRVAGNALIGLHLAGCSDTVDRALEMSRSLDHGRRSTAAWAMGKMGSGKFLERLKELLRDENAKVRSSAVRSLAEIGKAEAVRLAAIDAAVKEVELLASLAEAGPEPVTPDVPGAPFELKFDGSFKTGRRG
jgi:HEAT repeat protein